MPTKEQKTERLKAILDELFETANSFAGEETGPIACELHSSCNAIMRSLKLLENGITQYDKDKIMFDWYMKNVPAALFDNP